MSPTNKKLSDGAAGGGRRTTLQCSKTATKTKRNQWNEKKPQQIQHKYRCLWAGGCDGLLAWAPLCICMRTYSVAAAMKWHAPRAGPRSGVTVNADRPAGGVRPERPALQPRHSNAMNREIRHDLCCDGLAAATNLVCDLSARAPPEYMATTMQCTYVLYICVCV